MIRVIFLGAPGVGKGTQAKILSTECAVPHISTGDILRAAVKDQTELGKKAEEYMNAGELVPDDLILGLIRERLGQPDAQKGWILDGFPRNLSQADFLDNLLGEIEQPCECVLNLEVPDEVLVTRMVERGKQLGRKDDTEEVIRNRLDVYQKSTEPLIAYYRDRQQLISVDGNRPIESVTEELKQIIKPEEEAGE
ncbi:MAG: adenylate kinase [Cyanobacteria bacterium J06648_16]